LHLVQEAEIGNLLSGDEGYDAVDLDVVVIDRRGELLGTVSQNKMNREVGGFGHDPKTEPVEAHIDRNNPYCFEDQTVAAAEQIMLKGKVGEVFVVTREKFLVGTINIEAIAQEKRRRNAWKPLKSRA